MSQEIELQPFAWQACDALRGTLEYGKSVRVVLTLLIVKFLSDLKKLQEAGHSHSSLPIAWQELEIPPECDWNRLLQLDATASLSRELNYIARVVEQRNPSALGDALRIANFDELWDFPHNQSLFNALRLVSQIDFAPDRQSPHEIGAAFDDLLQELLQPVDKRAGYFYVPREISVLISKIVNLQEGERMLDPVCGAGQLLAKVAENKRSQIVGQDWRSSEIALCKMNLLLHGIPNPQLEVSNCLASPLRDKEGKLLQADIIISNPPFGMYEQQGQISWEQRFDLRKYGVSPRGVADYAFLAHMLESARDQTGRVAAIASLGSLTRANGAEFRRCIVEDNLLGAVISLPSGLFQATRIPVAILYFSKNNPHDEVVFIDASRCYTTHGSVNRITDEGLKRMIAVIQDSTEIPGFGRRVRREEIRANNYSLAVSLYIEPEGNKPKISALATAGQRIRLLETELDEVRSELNAALKEVGFQLD